MSDWRKDLSAIGFESADLVQRARTVTRAAASLGDDTPGSIAELVQGAATMLAAAVDLLEAGSDALLQLDDDEQARVLAGLAERAAGPRFSLPGRCGAVSSAVVPALRGNCCLTAGHDGWHRADDGMEWSR